MIIYLTENYSGEVKAFHGSDVKITDFSYEYVGGKEANDQYGSGFYFFTNEKYMFEYIGNNDYKQWNKLFKKIKNIKI